MGNIPRTTPPPVVDTSLTKSGVAADSKTVGDIFGSQFGTFHSKQFDSSDGPTYTFKITTTEDTSAQYYRTYFMLFLVGQGAQLMQATITWRGPSGTFSQEIQHGSATISHSNGTVTVKFPNGTWGRLYVCWWNNAISLS